MPDLNPTQESLLEEFCQEYVLPGVQQILVLCKSQPSKQICTYLIMIAIQGKLDSAEYKELLSQYLDVKKYSRIIERLTSLHKLFQPDNNAHIFMRNIIDKRFFSQLLDCSQNEWINACKEIITKHYATKIDALLQTLVPDHCIHALEIIKTQDSFVFQGDVIENNGPKF